MLVSLALARHNVKKSVDLCLYGLVICLSNECAVWTLEHSSVESSWKMRGRALALIQLVFIVYVSVCIPFDVIAGIKHTKQTHKHIE